MKTKLIALTALALSSIQPWALAQDSQPSFAFGNNVQGINGVDGGNINAVQAFNRLQEAADKAYKDKDYERAYDMYHRLAEFGDKFSQYRIAYMHQNGVGVEKDPIEAFAWSYVSAETKKKGLVNYHVALRDRLAENDKALAMEKAEQYLEDYGLYAIADNARQLIRDQRKQCVGSRLGNSCERISSSGITCNAFDAGMPGNACLTLGSVGLPALIGMQPQDVRLVENNLRNIMEQYSPGTVELGELEIIED
ncbi:MAG: hypothetical protein Tsb002_34160 [Wenzhouxiangellaceae bacterium]